MADWLAMACQYLFIFFPTAESLSPKILVKPEILSPIIAKSGFLANGECLARALTALRYLVIITVTEIDMVAEGRAGNPAQGCGNCVISGHRK